METQNRWKDIIWKLTRMPIIAWAIILLVAAFLLVQLPWDLAKKFAILPGAISLLLFYQAIFRGKMY
ncbi:MAG: hypothetical protein A2172_01515 [Candidatus Woykebacteria bacterium RBG_13_40_15]|uniref:Uncharacterized protein n=1 Tax=Candidatus Woykebacteria bacterium RBG_13_40_15 TaxID=1802593 RepID=A0A1G1W952_9BACT|nr:MAG: hypothetical protein A2172_01515 [Candidatus Woykebacteria bacterium RBG_13_40_15]